MSVKGVVTEPQGGLSAPAARLWNFGTALLDERSLTLSVAGNAVDLDRKGIEVLRHLLRHAGEVVTKDELLAAVWPGRILSDSALTSCVARLREAVQDEKQDIIKTVHGYGYRLVAQVRVTNQYVPPAARFDFKPGDHPPGRPLWNLIRRLGAGGHGEAWLGAHDKTREQRVFKFANDETTLGALKREITLFRLLNDSLGERARIVELLDWNLELEPCFVESRYIAGGSLLDWAERHGKLTAIPLTTRLDVAAQIADALAAVHGVGVLHKDLKPSNVLVEEVAGAAPKVRLADFGSGGLLDPERLEQLGITRAGFTRTMKVGEVEGTLLYLAPEVVAGQIPTVKADIYALGVMLYQLVLGDFRAAMSPGWERSIEDELLRECIADAAQGEPEQRLGDAAALGLRLRTLEDSRQKRRLERETKAKAEAASRALERLRARRVGLIAAGVALIAGMVVSTALYLDARSARDEATAAAASSKAVADYLSKDLFAQIGTKPLRDFTVTELVRSASTRLDQRSKDLPEVAAQLHTALGNAAIAVEDYDLAEGQLNQALASLEATGDTDSEAALSVAAQLLIFIKRRVSQIPERLPRYERILDEGQARLGNAHPAVLNLREQIATARFWGGDWKRAADDMRGLIQDQKAAGQPERIIGLGEARLGQVLVLLGDFAAAEELTRDGIKRLAADSQSSPLALAEARMHRAVLLAYLRQIQAAKREMSLVRELVRPWVITDDANAMLSVRATLGLVELKDGQWSNAASLLQKTIRQMAGRDWNKGSDMTAEWRSWLAEAYARHGRFEEATRELQTALPIAQTNLGSRHPITQRITIDLADMLRARDAAEAQRLLASVDADVIAGLGVDHPYAAARFRVEGLLNLQSGARDKARTALREALRIYTARYGAEDDLTRRTRAELASAER